VLKNSVFAEAQDFACRVSGIAHPGHEGIATNAENLALEHRSALAAASGEIAPLQIQISKSRALRYD